MKYLKNRTFLLGLVLRIIPRFIKSYLKGLIRQINSKNSVHTTIDEEICESYTHYPDLGDFVLPNAYKFFDWYYPNCEMNSKKWVVDNVEAHWNILDVGANVGVYSILFGKLANRGKVFALEPTSTFELLQKNLIHHKLTNVVPLNVGLSNKTALGEEDIFRLWGKPSEHSVYELWTLDDFATKHSLTEIDFIKIDTDGYELEILSQASFTLEKFNPWVMIEFSYALNTRGHEVGHLIEKLVSLGYSEALLLDGNNLITRKSIEPLDMWSKSLKIVPHEYLFNRVESEADSVNHVRMHEAIESVSPSEFFDLLGMHEDLLTELINPRLPGRGPKMEINDAPILARIFRSLDPKNHLEFGTWEGFGATLFCSNASGFVTTINLPDGEKGEEEAASTYPSSYYPATREKFTGIEASVPSDGGTSIGWIYKYYGYESRVKQILADSTDLTAPDFDTKFESIFIDGAHDSASVIADTKLALELLSEGGVLIWHDFTLLAGELENYSSTKGVFRAISECLKLLEQNGIKLYWIKESWLLVGKKG